MQGCWLVKQEPEDYSFEQLERDGHAEWDGVRNFQARNHLMEMKKGDRVLYYHSGKDRRVVGLARVVREAYPDPTASDPRWVAVDLEAVRALVRPVSLEEIKKDPKLRDLVLLRQPRLSVMPVRLTEYRRILTLGKTRA